jgi:glycosyltransferase involved in cell wall biosynthesis
MRVLAWVPQQLGTSPGQRFRIEQWAPLLSRHGIDIDFSPFAGPELTSRLARPGRPGVKAWGVLGALVRRLVEAGRTPRPDLVYIFRESALLGPSLAERLLSLRRIPFVFDFDDAVWVRYVSPTNGPLSYLRCPSKTATVCRTARHVMAGNNFLREYALRHNPRVSVVPTTIDTQKYAPLPHPPDRLPVIGWSGSFSTVQYMELVRPALETLARRRSFRLKIVGGSGVVVRGIEVECLPWRPETEVADIATFDVGLMPLSEDEWARGKCGLKALQYMALAVPAVVSPVGVNTEIVDHGKNGLLAATQDDWVEGLDRLLSDPRMRHDMGEAARITVEQRYSAGVVAPKVAGILRKAALGGRQESFP